MRALFTSLAASLALTLLASCTKSEAPAPTAPPEAPVAAQDGPAPIPPRVEGPVGDVLVAYEAARAKLAADDLPGAQPFATSLASAARTASEHAVTSKQAFVEIANAADRMIATKDIKEARKAFGEVSKNVVGLLVADPELRTGRFLFECPMVPEGYKRWVQTTSKLNNPYWGAEMLECGDQVKSWSI